MLKQEVLYFVTALDKRANGPRCGGKPLKKKGTNFGDGDYFRKGHTKSSVLTAWIDVNAYVFAPWPGIIRKYREGAKGRHVMYCALPVIMGSIDHACIK
jgi:hypothetical protein